MQHFDSWIKVFGSMTSPCTSRLGLRTFGCLAFGMMLKTSVKAPCTQNVYTSAGVLIQVLEGLSGSKDLDKEEHSIVTTKMLSRSVCILTLHGLFTQTFQCPLIKEYIHSVIWETYYNPRGSIYTTIMELGPQNHNEDGLLGPNSIIVVYMDPLRIYSIFLD